MRMHRRFRSLRLDWAGLRRQFTGIDLDLRRAGQWPAAPRWTAYLLLALAALGGGAQWLVVPAYEVLQAEREREPALRADYRLKLGKALRLDALKQQKREVEQAVNQLEKQLPGRAEMDALLADINQAGVGRGLQFELFRPGLESVRDHYAELPIALRIGGRYHDLGAFAADIAKLSRIVTLHKLVMVQPGGSGAVPGVLSFEAEARTYRYLDAEELAARRKPRGSGAASRRPKPADDRAKP